MQAGQACKLVVGNPPDAVPTSECHERASTAVFGYGGGKSIFNRGQLQGNREGCIVARPVWKMAVETFSVCLVPRFLSRGGFGMNERSSQ